LGVWIKESVKAHVWYDPSGEDHLAAEKMWVLIEGVDYELALGLVYMATEGASTEEWNDTLEEELQSDIQTHIDARREILLIGDFNGHVATDSGLLHGLYGSSNRNGRRVVGLATHNDLHLLNNFQDKCTGQWTWCRGQHRSVVDYVLASNIVMQDLKSMEVDEGGKWEVGTDHNWITLEWQRSVVSRSASERDDNHGPSKRWNISDATNWPKYRRVLRDSLQPWHRDTATIQDYGEDLLELGYKALQTTIIASAEQTVGGKCANQ
jgi:hypothetical protein